jgi:hypothetical protein
MMTAVPSISTPRSWSYDSPAATLQLIFGSRRRLTTFCDLAFVSKYTFPSSRPYHIATRWGNPFGPSVAIVAVRFSCRSDVTSSSVMRMPARWLSATGGSFPIIRRIYSG